ncbi:MAG: DUF2680 domain-containing protein [Oscillospiraceae bacterium]|nr:DUF2680 domain-containing protein [Oscillospiraceae bacterium]
MKFKKLTLALAVVLAVGAFSATAMAATGYQTSAEIVAGLTGRTTDSVTDEKTESGKTYGTIANEAGVLDQFKSQMIEQKKELLEEKVAAGTVTQERADTIIAAMENNQANCDGTGSGMGTRSGARTGTGTGMGLGGGRSGNGLGCRAGGCY